MSNTFMTVCRERMWLRLLSGRCELCENPGKVVVHQVRKLANLDKWADAGQPAWAALMARKRRKTLVVCRPCHDTIHEHAAVDTA